MKLSFALRAAFAGALLLVLLTAALSFRSSRTLLDESGWVIHTQEARGSLSQLLSSLEAAATAEHGFIMSGDETYLGPYNAAERDVPGQVRHLRKLVADNAEQTWRLNGLQPHIDALLAGMQEAIDTRRQGGAARRTSEVGKRELEAVRETIRAMDDFESRLLHDRAAAVEVAARLATATFAAAAVLAVLLIGLLYAALRHHLRLRAEADRAREELLFQAQTARVAAEEGREKLAEANRAKDAFLATVSHELRTPLSPIVMWAEVLKRGNLDAEQSRLAVESIQRCAKAQSQLVEDLLDVSRITAGQMRLDVQPVDLPDVIRSGVEVVQPAADAKSIRVETAIDTESALVSGDPQRLQQVIWNLLSNAIKFTPNGGHVTIALGCTNSHAEIAISDTGQGISADFLPYLFERFRRADLSSTRKLGGLGLGLAIVRYIVEAHGGSVDAESPGPGRGAVFTVKLPLIRLSADEAKRRRPTEVTPSPQSTATLDGLRVLAVDDDTDCNEAVRQLLGSCGAEVRLAASVPDALDVLASWSPQVLVTDIALPGEDGYSLIAKLRTGDAYRHLPAIALTAHASVDDRVRALAAGFLMHLSKPFEPAELLAAVANVAVIGKPVA